MAEKTSTTTSTAPKLPPPARCPGCDHAVVVAIVLGHVTICQFCGASLVRTPDGGYTRATFATIDQLTPQDRAALTKVRGKIARGDR